MGRSSLLGPEYADIEPAGRDTAALGPGDSSDSGSDMAGIADSAGGDPNAPVDVALRDDMPHSLVPPASMGGAASDAAGTGERRSAASDGGLREASDIGVDRVFVPGGPGDPDVDEDAGLSDDEDADLAFIDTAQAGEPLDDEGDDEVEDQTDGTTDTTGDGLSHAIEEDDGIPGAHPNEPGSRRRRGKRGVEDPPPQDQKPAPTEDGHADR